MVDCPYNSGGYCDHVWAENDNAPRPDGWYCRELVMDNECPLDGWCEFCGASLTEYDLDNGECPRCNSTNVTAHRLEVY